MKAESAHILCLNDNFAGCLVISHQIKMPNTAFHHCTWPLYPKMLTETFILACGVTQNVVSQPHPLSKDDIINNNSHKKTSSINLSHDILSYNHPHHEIRSTLTQKYCCCAAIIYIATCHQTIVEPSSVLLKAL